MALPFGAASAIIDLDKRKVDPYSPWKRDENIFIVNSLGDRKAFAPLAEPWKRPQRPAFEKRKARIAVGHFSMRDAWGNENLPEAMFRVLDAAAKGDLASARQWHEKLFQLCREMLGLATNPIPLKAAMRLLGRDSGEMRLPMTPLESGLESKLRSTLGSYGIL